MIKGRLGKITAASGILIWRCDDIRCLQKTLSGHVPRLGGEY